MLYVLIQRFAEYEDVIKVDSNKEDISEDNLHLSLKCRWSIHHSKRLYFKLAGVKPMDERGLSFLPNSWTHGGVSSYLTVRWRGKLCHHTNRQKLFKFLAGANVGFNHHVEVPIVNAKSGHTLFLRGNYN